MCSDTEGPACSRRLNDWLQIKISIPKERSSLLYIKALLDPYAKYCGLRKDPYVTKTRAECFQKSFLSASGQGSVIAEEHPVGSS